MGEARTRRERNQRATVGNKTTASTVSGVSDLSLTLAAALQTISGGGRSLTVTKMNDSGNEWNASALYHLIDQTSFPTAGSTNMHTSASIKRFREAAV